MKMFRAPIGLLAMVLACLALAAGPASADTILTLNSPNTVLSGYAGPYGTVDVHLNGNGTATVTFQAAASAAYNFAFGSNAAAAVSSNGANSLVTNISGTAHPGGLGPQLSNSNPLPANVSSFGSMTNVLDEFDGAQYSLTTIVFKLTKSSGSWASDADVLVANSDGFKAAAHIFVFDATVGDGWQLPVLATGFSGDGTTNVVPEPASIVIALTGLGGLGLARILRRRVAVQG